MNRADVIERERERERERGFKLKEYP